jgi:hypothetical protein
MATPALGNAMKLTTTKTGRAPPAKPTTTFAAPTPRVSRQKPAKVLSAAERIAFLASRPDLKPSE